MNKITEQADWHALTAFVRATLALPVTLPLSPATTLLDDLRVDGDDGDAFMAAFAARFDVAPGDFAEQRYFGPEGFFLHGMLASWFGRRAPLEPLTLGMLYLAMQAKVWDSQALAQARDGGLFR